MSGVVQRTVIGEITSAAGAVATGAFRLGANVWDIQFVIPAGASLSGVEGSNDKLNWNTMIDATGNDIVNLGALIKVGLNRPKWLRYVLSADVSQPRKFITIQSTGKEQGG